MNYNINYDILVYRLLVSYLIAQARQTGQRDPIQPIKLVNIEYVERGSKFLIEYQEANGVYRYVTM